MPPTRASLATAARASVLGCEPRWSEMAISPTPTHCSTRMMSRRTEPVSVGVGTRYAPVHM